MNKVFVSSNISSYPVLISYNFATFRWLSSYHLKHRIRLFHIPPAGGVAVKYQQVEAKWQYNWEICKLLFGLLLLECEAGHWPAWLKEFPMCWFKGEQQSHMASTLSQMLPAWRNLRAEWYYCSAFLKEIVCFSHLYPLFPSFFSSRLYLPSEAVADSAGRTLWPCSAAMAGTKPSTPTFTTRSGKNLNSFVWF